MKVQKEDLKIFPYHSNSSILCMNDPTEWRHAWGWFRYIKFDHYMFRNGITNTLVQNFAVWIPYVKTVQKSLRELNMLNKIDIHVHESSLLMSSLRAMVICQKYIRITEISSQILVFAPSLVMRRWTVDFKRSTEYRKKNKTAEYISLFIRYFEVDNDWNQSLVSGNTPCA